MKVLFDTNVVLDVLMNREPFADAAAELLSKVENGSVAGYLCATTITTIYFLIAKELGAARAHTEVKKLTALFEIASINRPVLESALDKHFADFEDAVLHESAKYAAADAIVTRNPKDFKRAEMPVYTSAELVKILITL
jgi:predicted nucleic acid-binding protein